MRKRASVSFAVARLAALSVTLLLATGVAAAQEGENATTPTATAASGVPVEVWNREIVVVRASYESVTPEARATTIRNRILALPSHQSEYRIEVRPASLGAYSGAWITVNDRLAFGLLAGDVDVESGETFDELTQRATANLREWLVARDEQGRIPTLLRGVGLAVAATAVFLILIGGLVRYGRRFVVRLQAAGEEQARSTHVAGVNVRPYLIALGIGVMRLVNWGIALALAYAWLTFVLRQFPYSQPWGQRLSASLVDLAGTFGHGLLASMPNIAALLVIFLLTRLVVRVTSTFFRGAEAGAVEATWLRPETARATRRVLVVLIWTFALVVSYPYIPGSNTSAFKGVSVFLGLMVSLGSAGLVGQIIGGLVVVYSGAFRIGDFAKIGEHEGTVKEMGLLSTKIETVTKQEITIPNTVLVGATVVNYSSESRGSAISTTVTIGYDAPWRQIHALLLLAAERTQRVLAEPRPVVQQRSLADFYVEYRLVFAIERPAERYLVLTELHQQIQDAFNEFGVQIMSPNFVDQPAQPVLVPKEQWFVAPFRPDGSSPAPDESSAGRPPAT